MYTLVLVIYFALGQGNGGTAVTTLVIPGFKSEQTCAREAERNQSRLMTTLKTKEYDPKTIPSEVRWSCFQVS